MVLLEISADDKASADDNEDIETINKVVFAIMQHLMTDHQRLVDEHMAGDDYLDLARCIGVN